MTANHVKYPPPNQPQDQAFDTVRTSLTTGFKSRVPVKVVSERLGHATPAFTMTVYQHVLPGMQAEAATTFADSSSGLSDCTSRG